MKFFLPASGIQSENADSGKGVTLLEAYSALAKQRAATAAVEIPFPGQPCEADPNGAFWKIRVQQMG